MGFVIINPPLHPLSLRLCGGRAIPGEPEPELKNLLQFKSNRSSCDAMGRKRKAAEEMQAPKNERQSP